MEGHHAGAGLAVPARLRVRGGEVGHRAGQGCRTGAAQARGAGLPHRRGRRAVARDRAAAPEQAASAGEGSPRRGRATAPEVEGSSSTSPATVSARVGGRAEEGVGGGARGDGGRCELPGEEKGGDEKLPPRAAMHPHESGSRETRINSISPEPGPALL